MSTKTRSHAIYVDVDPVRVTLDDFDVSDIREYLSEQDSTQVSATGEGGVLTIGSADIDRITTLALCGQQQHAREFVLELVERHIGRKLR